MENLIYILSVVLLFVFVFFLIKSSDDNRISKKKSPVEKKTDPVFIETPEAERSEIEYAVLEFAKNNPEKTAFVIRQLFFSDDE